MDYLKQNGDLALLVGVEIKDTFILCNYLYLHHNCPAEVQVTGDKGTFTVNLSDYLKPTPTDYVGDINVKLANV